MASRGYEHDGSHDAVVSNLMDLQARLRGDPASLVLPRGGRRLDSTTVAEGDVSVTVSPEEHGDPERRIESLRRRLEYLELEIDAYEQVADEAQADQAPAPINTDVGELQHVVEERLTASDDEPPTFDEPPAFDDDAPPGEDPVTTP
jgi:hypothetical protein